MPSLLPRSRPHPPAARPRARARPRAAFTILEVMMAAIVLALAITTSITTLQHGFLALDTARNTTIAGQIMQSELERMRLKDWATVNAYAAGPTPLTLVTDSTALDHTSAFVPSAALAQRFTLTRTTSDVHADLKQITLTITWRSSDGRTLTRAYPAYYGKNGLYDFFYNTY